MTKTKGFFKNQFYESIQENFIASKSFFPPNKSYSAFCPCNFQGKFSGFFEIRGTNFESKKGKSRLENDVIEVGDFIFSSLILVISKSSS